MEIDNVDAAFSSTGNKPRFEIKKVQDLTFLSSPYQPLPLFHFDLVERSSPMVMGHPSRQLRHLS